MVFKIFTHGLRKYKLLYIYFGYVKILLNEISTTKKLYFVTSQKK